MSLNAAAIRLMADKGLSANDIAEIAEAMAVVKDRTAAERQQRRRDKVKAGKGTVERDESRVTSRRDEPDLPPNDIYSNPPSEPSGAKAPVTPFADQVVSAWNDGPGKRGATKARTLDAGRRKSLAARVREHGEDGVLAAIRGIECSDFHCGIGEKSYRTNLGWLLKSPEHFVSAMERAGDAPAPAAPVDPAAQAAHLDRLRSAPWMRGRENELALPRSAGPPRPIGQLAAGIASRAA
jgi:hypothetical protein